MLFVCGFLPLVTLHYTAKTSITMADPRIPMGLSEAQNEVYEKLIDVVKQRQARGETPRPIVVITDIGKDYDDLAALVVLTEFHHLKLIELRAVVANLKPADARAHLASAALVSLGLQDIPVARGTPGSLDEHEVLDHEFKGAEFSRGDSVVLEDGPDLLLKAYLNAKENNEKLYLLCLSSLQDIYEFESSSTDTSALVAEHTAEVHMQGGNRVSEGGHNLKPDFEAANNRFNWDAAKKWHSFIQEKGIRSHTYTKVAAFAAPLPSEVFEELKATGHPIGAYLRRVQVEQDVAFYKQACESDSKKRFAPFMDQKWFLAKKTNWHQRPHPSEGDALPTGEEVIPYLTKIVLYDVHAALGVAGEDVVRKLRAADKNVVGELKVDRTIKSESGKVVDHWITDCDLSQAVVEKISLAMSSLLKGAFLRRTLYK